METDDRVRRVSDPAQSATRYVLTPPTPTWSARSSTCARTTTSASKDLDVPQSLPRRDDPELWSLANPKAARHEPVPDLTALRTPRQVRWRFEKQLSGHQAQIDVKFIEPIRRTPRKKYDRYTAIDDCTRLRVLRTYPPEP
jgi:hypothetical protein